MTLKSHVADIVSGIERRTDELPDQVNDARKSVAAWGSRMQRFARKNPGVVLVGAFALGFALAKVARHA